MEDEGLCRAGWSTQAASLDLGTDKNGLGFGATAKKSHNRQFDVRYQIRQREYSDVRISASRRVESRHSRRVHRTMSMGGFFFEFVTCDRLLGRCWLDLDVEGGSCGFDVNGKSFGNAFAPLPQALQGVALFPAVAMRNAQLAVIFLS